jgi:hypothetical protein
MRRTRTFALTPTLITVVYSSAWWFAVAAPGLLHEQYQFATAPTLVWLVILVSLTVWRWVRPPTPVEHWRTMVVIWVGTGAVAMWVAIWLPMLALEAVAR